MDSQMTSQVKENVVKKKSLNWSRQTCWKCVENDAIGGVRRAFASNASSIFERVCWFGQAENAFSRDLGLECCGYLCLRSVLKRTHSVKCMHGIYIYIYIYMARVFWTSARLVLPALPVFACAHWHDAGTTHASTVVGSMISGTVTCHRKILLLC